MVVIEGKGIVRPNPIRVAFSKADLNLLSDIAERREQHRGYSRSKSKWKSGSTGNPILCGLVGEFAFQEFLRRRGVKTSIVDDSLNSGDGGIDGRICGKTYQVKTSRRAFQTCLVRRVGEGRNLIPLAANRFVFCCWNGVSLHCDLRGWCERPQIRKHGQLKKARVRGATWRNTEVHEHWLLPMQSLAVLIKQELSND